MNTHKKKPLYYYNSQGRGCDFTLTRIVSAPVSSGVMCEAELSFTLEPSDIIAVQEQPLMLHCQVNGIPPITIQWRHNGLLVAQDRNHTTVINGSLLISHFQKTKRDGSSDEGDYECVAQNSFGLVVSRRARIQAASKSLWLHPAFSLNVGIYKCFYVRSA